MPSQKPEPSVESRASDEPGRSGALRADLLPAAGVGAIMGFLAENEGSGIGVAIVVGVVGCALVLGMLALKRAFYGR